jgi:hypothetical protein
MNTAYNGGNLDTGLGNAQKYADGKAEDIS